MTRFPTRSPDFEWTECPLCGSPGAKTYLEGPDRVHPIEGTFRLVRCSGCGLVYQNPRPTPGRLARHYPADYEPYRATRRTPLSRLGWHHGYELYLRCRFVARFKSGGHLLDVGCASGTFLSGIRDFGDWRELWGIEMSPRAAALARRRGLDVVIGRIEDMALPRATFDAVTLWDVLEHLADPTDQLRRIHGSLKPDGVLFLNVPVLDSLDARLFGRHWIGFDLPRHLLTPSRMTIVRLLEEAGFSVLATGYPTGGHHSFTQSLRLSIDSRFGRSSTQQPLTRLTFSTALRALLMPYILGTGLLGLGASLTLAARRRTGGE